MKHSSHWACALFGALTILLVVLDAGAWTFVPAVACAASCVHMVVMTVRGERTGRHRHV